MIVFKYRKEGAGIAKRTVKRPVATVYLKSTSGEWIRFNPYIDSGADITLIPLSLGKLLGFKRRQKDIVKISGVSGSISVIFKKVKAKIGEKEFDMKLTWAMTEKAPPILGRKDVFDNFIISFKQKAEEIIFEPLK